MHYSLKESNRIIELFEQRAALLRAISELNATISTQGQDDLLERCCKILIGNKNYCLVWAGKREDDDNEIIPISAVNSAKIADRDCMRLLQEVVLDLNETNPAAKALQNGEPVIIQDISKEDKDSPLLKVALETGFHSCLSWPLIYKEREYGVLTIHSEQTHFFEGSELDFLAGIAL